MTTGGGNIASDRDLGLKATSLYFALLAIPGSSAFKVFHPVLYNKALDTFKLAMKLHLVSPCSLCIFNHNPSIIWLTCEAVNKEF